MQKFDVVLRKLAEGATVADLLDAYPRLTREDIQAALGYAADAVAHELFAVLRDLDASGVREIWVETPPAAPCPVWKASKGWCCGERCAFLRSF